jgi:hypothetical protein
MKLQSFFVSLALLPVALFAGGPNSGGTTGTPTGPTVIPAGAFTSAYVISTPGSYVLGGNRTVSGVVNAIEITAPDVTLDLGGFSLAPNVTGGLKTGIYIANADNVEIRNGSVGDASDSGIWAEAGQRVRVLNVRVTATGNYGIRIGAGAAQIEHCQISDCSFDNILVSGAGALVTDCMVTGGGTGVYVEKDGRVIRSIASGCKYGFYLYQTSTATECTATGGQYGLVLGAYCTMRNCELLKNVTGLSFSAGNGLVLVSGSRMSGNTTNVVGGAASYTDGGGNSIF